jgi:hypothetical protein
MYNVLTSFNEKYWLEVARNNVILLNDNWPKKYQLSLYHQLESIENISSRIKWFDLYQTCPELINFSEKWKNHPKANGSHSNKPNMAFRWNAIKFCHKTFAIWHQSKVQTSGWLIWLDCDAVVKKSVDDHFLRTVCPNDYAISFMGRPGKYSECGFIGFNLDRHETRQFLSDWEDLYLTGKFIDLPETHDSWTFDWIRKQKDPSLFFNVNSKAITNKNPFAQSLIGSHIAHAKGSGKQKQIDRILNRVN